MKRLQLVLSTLALALLPAASRADQINFAPIQDNTIFSESSNSAGGENGVFVGSNNSAGTPSRRGLIQFDLSSIPAGSTITGATLTMYLEMANNATARTIDLHRANVAWGEGTAGSGQTNGTGFTAGAGDATWTEAMHGVSSWPAGGDFASAVSASASISGTTVGTPFSWTSATLLSDVQGWYANASSNHGWEMISNGEGTGGSVKTFYTKEFTGVTLRPVLSVTYVPEPATLGLLSLVIPAYASRRRRSA
ncbi:MAG TPA: DNRLRE domain-containing protein [Lacipirellulaceae bacterium]|jgi:hypothetical protein|nr:DNRLRE domain-containing protein [Lacipirellulaceae bacterium]